MGAKYVFSEGAKNEIGGLKIFISTSRVNFLSFFYFQLEKIC